MLRAALGKELESRGKGADMDPYESHLQEDGTTFPPVTPDAPSPPGVELPEVPDPEIAAPEGDTAEPGAEFRPG